MSAAEQLIGFESDIEITLEANPGTFEQEKFADFYECWHQSTVDRHVRALTSSHLQRLGRIHDGRSVPWKPLSPPGPPGLLILILI